MSVLEIVDPGDCDEHGVPLDWERCRTCGGVGKVLGGPVTGAVFRDDVKIADVVPGRRSSSCSTCDGHGSLKAAALAGLTLWRDGIHDGEAYRCEGCGHPMSDGTWEPGEDSTTEVHPKLWPTLVDLMREGIEPKGNWPIHYSPCDEGCRHGGPLRIRVTTDGPWIIENRDCAAGARTSVLAIDDGAVEASWRAVDVRTLGWAHDLRPEKLSVLCLRCWAART